MFNLSYNLKEFLAKETSFSYVEVNGAKCFLFHLNKRGEILFENKLVSPQLFFNEMVSRKLLKHDDEVTYISCYSSLISDSIITPMMKCRALYETFNKVEITLFDGFIKIKEVKD